MNKAELATIIAEGRGFQKNETLITIDDLLAIIKDTLSKGERVELRGFGTFGLKNRKAKIGRNPKTGVVVPIPARRVPHFKPSPEFRKLIEEKSGS